MEMIFQLPENDPDLGEGGSFPRRRRSGEAGTRDCEHAPKPRPSQTLGLASSPNSLATTVSISLANGSRVWVATSSHCKARRRYFAAVVVFPFFRVTIFPRVR